MDLAVEWPTNTTINVWGMNLDGSPDMTMQYGDVDLGTYHVLPSRKKLDQGL